jgi:hypothetical protein
MYPDRNTAVDDYRMPVGVVRENADSSVVQLQFQSQTRELLLRDLLHQYKNITSGEHLPGGLPLISWNKQVVALIPMHCRRNVFDRRYAASLGGLPISKAYPSVAKGLENHRVLTKEFRR